MGHHVRTPGRSGSVSTGIAIQTWELCGLPWCTCENDDVGDGVGGGILLVAAKLTCFPCESACPYAIWLYGPKCFLNNQSCLPPSRSLECMNVRTSSLHWFKFCARPFTRTFSSWSDEVFTCSNKAHRTSETDHPILASGPETAFF